MHVYANGVRRPSGFSLVEMAIALLILGIVTSGVIVSVSQTVGGARRSATLAQLRQVEDALYGFAQSQGRLPCPAAASTNGYENISSGTCVLSEGFIPNATLGLYGQVNANGLLVDAWQNPLRYAVVNNDLAGNYPAFTNPDSIREFFNNGVKVAGTGHMLKICSRITSGSGSCGGADVITDAAPAVVYSMGANWNSYGPGSEVENADADTVFVAAAYNEALFDDQLIWLSPYVVFNRLVSAGKLP